MDKLMRIERLLLMGHIASMGFGLAGLLLVLPHPEFIAQLPEIGKVAFQWSMAGGGVVYMLLGFAAVTLYALRTLGTLPTLGFLIPALGVSVSAELLGTSTGFPFGYYRYLSGLGYKIAGLVPFTIPLSWFYLGFCAYLLVRAGLKNSQLAQIWQELTAIAVGATLLMSWDFVLDPAMSQTTMPFWVWDVPGAFFGMPYQNFAGWFGTGFVFMTIATGIWRFKKVDLPTASLGLPLAIYLSNFAFATVMSVGANIYPPIFLGLLLGVAPAIYFYRRAGEASREVAVSRLQAVIQKDKSDLATVK
ncbi:MAG: carotenoid biosynthesis protein [Synechocystis sp.]|nr:carotenoid biosynthesis protein [Synechocystis sp.]